ncbi:MAG: hypothetical protein ACTSYD_09210 [Candidatus Heimdallarchaeaceae archaeon]
MAHTAYAEFFDRIISKGLIDFDKKLESIKSLVLVLGDYLKSFVVFTMIDPSGDTLVPLVCSEEPIQLESIKPFLHNLSEQENFDLVFISKNVVTLPFPIVEDNISKYLTSKGYTQTICVPIRYNAFTVGCLIILISDYFVDEISSLSRFLRGLGLILGDLITRWIEEERFHKEITQSNFIINLTKLSLSTTEVQRILDNIFQGITDLTGVRKKAIFIRDITKLNCVKSESIPQTIISNILDNQYQVENIPFFNVICPITDYLVESCPTTDYELDSENYAILLPIGLTNVMLGLFLLIGTKEQLNINNVHLFRVICDLLFVTLQRTKLLDDMQRTIQSAEFSSYPVILVNSNFEILYLNERAEKLFNTNQRIAVNLDLFYLLKPEMEDRDFLKAKITEVVSTISRVSVKLSLDITEPGETTKRTFFILLEPTINNLTGEYCIVLSFIDISEAEALQSLAEEYSKRADIYFNILTHDIYNILFAISGYYELIKHKLPPEDLDILKRIDALTKRGTDIVRDIRALSTILKLSRDQQRYAIPLKMTLAKTLDEIKIELEELNVQLVYNIDLSPEIRIEGSSLVSYMFLYIFRVLTHNSSSVVELDIKGSITTDPINKKQRCILQIITSNHMCPRIKSILADTPISTHEDKKIKDNLARIIISEITKQFNYRLNVTTDIESEKVVVTITMPAI